MGQEQTAQVVLTVDVVVFRDMSQGPEVLLIQRGKPPYQWHWALPGGKLDAIDPSLEYAACREVQEETGLVLGEVLQIGTFGDVGRDPRGRYVSVLYAACVWPEVSFVQAGDDAASAAWFPISHLPSPLAFDHEALVSVARLSMSRGGRI